MTMQEFVQLPDIEKEETILDNGTFLSTHHAEDKIFDTYQLESFYVQFYYDLEGNDQTSIICFPDPDQISSFINRHN